MHDKTKRLQRLLRIKMCAPSAQVHLGATHFRRVSAPASEAAQRVKHEPEHYAVYSCCHQLGVRASELMAFRVNRGNGRTLGARDGLGLCAARARAGLTRWLWCQSIDFFQRWERSGGEHLKGVDRKHTVCAS